MKQDIEQAKFVYEVIADYPDSKFKLGDKLTWDDFYEHFWINDTKKYFGVNPHGYPHIFKLLNKVQNDAVSDTTESASSNVADNPIKIKPEGNTAQKEVKMTFGLTEKNLEVIEKYMIWDGAEYSDKVWECIGLEIGWHPLTAALWYFRKLAATHPDKDNGI